ncbi:MAG TPA: ROK family glucokinase [Kineosporiaceae bacterium]|nr:ROK family glucokinase [Kineosporiaceae bacterium]
MDLTIGVDVGGTKIAAGVVDASGRLLAKVRVSTPATTAEDVEEAIVEAVRWLLIDHDVSAIGLAVPGFVDEKRSMLRFTPNLPMVDRPLRDLVGARVGRPVVVENDANAAAWGEHRFGGGRRVPDMVLVTVGTGLGGGIVFGGSLVRGAFGVAAEIGHMRVVPGGLPCGCGNHGCWEQYCAGRALVRRAQALCREDAVAGAALLELAGQDADALTGSMVARAAFAGDQAAVGLFADVGRWLGEGIALLAAVLDPAVVVVGGGVAEAGDVLLDPARQAYAAALSAGSHRPHLEIMPAVLGNDAGLIGAADLARLP